MGWRDLSTRENSLLHGRAGQRRVVSDALGQPVSITEAHRELPGASLSLTLDANIQQRTEEVLGAVGKVFNPKDATAIVMDPRSGAILAMANWPEVNANDPGASPRGAMENQRGRLRLRTGLDVQGGHGRRRAPAGADHAEHSRSHPRPDPGRRPDHPRRHRTRRRDAHDGADPRPVEQRRRDQDRHARGRQSVQRLGAPLRVRRADRRRAARRGTGRGAAAEPVLGLIDGQPADRPGRARHADPDGDRVFGDRQRRHPAPAAHRRASVAAAPSRSPPAGA